MPSISWTLSPSSQSVPAGSPATLTDTWAGGIGTSQDFTFTDNLGGGVFSPTTQTAVTSPSSFTYTNATPGTYTIDVTPGSGPLNSLAPKQVTVIVTSPAVSGSATLQGSGTLSAVRTAMAHSASVMTGAGSLLATGTTTSPSATCALKGSGSLSLTALASITSYAYLQGQGTLIATTSVPYNATLKGSGTLLATPSASVTVSSLDYKVVVSSPIHLNSPATFTVTRLRAGAAATITPASVGAGTFTGVPVTLPAFGAGSVTFTFTPTSTGIYTFTFTNSGGLLNPGSLTVLADGLLAAPCGGTTVTTISATNLPLTLPYTKQRDGFSSVGYQVAWGSLSADTTITDGSTATGIDQSLNGLASVTAGVDIGQTLSISSLSFVVGCTTGTATMVVETSTDSTSWTPLTSVAPIGAGTFVLTTGSIASGLPVSARYVRISLKENSTTAHVAIRRIALTITPATITYTVPDFPGAQYIYRWTYKSTFSPTTDSGGTGLALTIKPFLEEEPDTLTGSFYTSNNFGKVTILQTSGVTKPLGPTEGFNAFDLQPIADHIGGTATFAIDNEGVFHTSGVNPPTITLTQLDLVITAQICQTPSWSAASHNGVITFAWVSTSGTNNTIKTAQHRSIKANVGLLTTGWEASGVVETGMNSTVFCYYTQLGTAMLSYRHNNLQWTRINKSMGAGGLWQSKMPPLYQYQQPWAVGQPYQVDSTPAADDFGNPSCHSSGSNDRVAYVFPGLLKATGLDGEKWRS